MPKIKKNVKSTYCISTKYLLAYQLLEPKYGVYNFQLEGNENFHANLKLT